VIEKVIIAIADYILIFSKSVIIEIVKEGAFILESGKTPGFHKREEVPVAGESTHPGFGLVGQGSVNVHRGIDIAVFLDHNDPAEIIIIGHRIYLQLAQVKDPVLLVGIGYIEPDHRVCKRGQDHLPALLPGSFVGHADLQVRMDVEVDLFTDISLVGDQYFKMGRFHPGVKKHPFTGNDHIPVVERFSEDLKACFGKQLVMDRVSLKGNFIARF